MNTVKYIITIIGTIMIIGSFFLYRNNNAFLETAITTKGEVIELLESRSDKSTTYKPLVQFIDEQGKQITFTTSSSSNPPSYSVGENVEVLYNPKASGDAKIKGFFSLWLGTLIVGALGAILFAIGVFMFISTKKKSDLMLHLKQNGRRIDSDFQNVALNTSLAVNGRNPFQIITQWQNPTTSKLHIFKSDDIWYDPTNYIKNDKIPVLIDMNNPKKYWIDLSFLPEVAE